MKFTAGYWNMRPGTIPYFASEARDIEIGEILSPFTPLSNASSTAATRSTPLP
jgi:hypothetical protein